MKVNIDFQLNHKFGVVERIVFRMVLNGFCDARGIYSVMTLFSDSVVANAVKKLVNQQIITADVEHGRLTVSEPLIALIAMCLDNTYEIKVPESLVQEILEEGLMVTGGEQKEVILAKEALLKELLPGIKIDTYLGLLDFIIYADKRG